MEKSQESCPPPYPHRLPQLPPPEAVLIARHRHHYPPQPIAPTIPHFNPSFSSHAFNVDFNSYEMELVDINAPYVSEKSGLAVPNSTPRTLHNAAPVVIDRKIKFQTWFTPYRLLLTLVVTLNGILTLLAISGHGKYMRTHLTAMVLGNLLISIAVRNEWILRLLYWGAIMTFRWKPVPKKLKVYVVALLYHIGGLHSGCGVSAFLWLVVSWGAHVMQRRLYHATILVSLFLSFFCVMVSSLGAVPIIRTRHHNFFEITHRFFGWLGIITTLIFVITSIWWDPVSHSWRPFADLLLNEEEFWFVMMMICLLVSAWTTVSKVPVQYVHTSSKASVLRMPGGLTSGLHTRISQGGLKEWHIFGSISEGKCAFDHYLVIAVQGDFTKMLNTKQPNFLYTKTWKPCGLPYFSRLFDRGVAICTGSGIGAVGSTCIQNSNWFLVWIGPNLEETYGKEFMGYIHSHINSERRIIWDTRILGRPNIPNELVNVFHSWSADVALFIGSPAVNKEVLRSCRARKIPVFGSIWDA